MAERHQRRSGTDKYIWWSRRDGKVRKEHAALHGTVRRWDKPHPTEGHPGQKIGCRCTPIPYTRSK